MPFQDYDEGQKVDKARNVEKVKYQKPAVSIQHAYTICSFYINVTELFDKRL